MFLALAFVIAAPLEAGSQAAQRSELPRWEFGFAGGLHFFGPVRASVDLAAGLKRAGSTELGRSRFIFLALEPGLGGQRASLGYAESLGSAAGGWSARGSLLKLTSEPARRTLAGVEVQAIVVYCVGARIGAFSARNRDRSRGTVMLADLSVCL